MELQQGHEQCRGAHSERTKIVLPMLCVPLIVFSLLSDRLPLSC